MLRDTPQYIRYEIGCAKRHFAQRARERGVEPKSRLYAIKDFGGGWRYVITEPWEIKYHPIEGELVFCVPQVWIAEPIEWEEISHTLSLARRYAEMRLMKNRSGALSFRP